MGGVGRGHALVSPPSKEYVVSILRSSFALLEEKHGELSTNSRITSIFALIDRKYLIAKR